MKQVVMSQWQLRSLIQRMEQIESRATMAGNLELAFKIQQKILEVGFALHPEWDQRKVAPKASNGVKPSKAKVAEPEPEAPTTPTDADMAALRELSDDELEKSLGMR